MELNNEIGLDEDILIYLTTRLIDLSFYPFFCFRLYTSTRVSSCFGIDSKNSSTEGSKLIDV